MHRPHSSSGRRIGPAEERIKPGKLSRPEQKATVATKGLAVMVSAAASSASSETSLVKIFSSVCWMVVSFTALPLSFADAVGSKRIYTNFPRPSQGKKLRSNA